MMIRCDERTKTRDTDPKRYGILPRIAVGLVLIALCLPSCGAQPSGGNASALEHAGQPETNPDPAAAVTDEISEDTDTGVEKTGGTAMKRALFTAALLIQAAAALRMI